MNHEYLESTRLLAGINISGTHDLDRFMQHARSRVPVEKAATEKRTLSENERTLAVLSCCYSSRRGCVLSNMVRMSLNLQVHSPAHAQTVHFICEPMP